MDVRWDGVGETGLVCSQSVSGRSFASNPTALLSAIGAKIRVQISLGGDFPRSAICHYSHDQETRLQRSRPIAQFFYFAQPGGLTDAPRPPPRRVPLLEKKQKKKEGLVASSLKSSIMGVTRI